METHFLHQSVLVFNDSMKLEALVDIPSVKMFHKCVILL